MFTKELLKFRVRKSEHLEIFFLQIVIVGEQDFHW